MPSLFCVHQACAPDPQHVTGEEDGCQVSLWLLVYLMRCNAISLQKYTNEYLREKQVANADEVDQGMQDIIASLADINRYQKTHRVMEQRMRIAKNLMMLINNREHFVE